ncbi:MAG: hypothetical protein JXR53_01155 [Bacteroidales bacterium]|nr:hypothetical protein [Bacteroidales bacterium]
MLSTITRRQIEKKFGQEIRYPSDCDALAAHIQHITKQNISVSTLKRILGFVSGVKEPRLFTLDVLAKYIGYENWDVYLENFSKIENSDFVNLEQITVSELDKGVSIEFYYDPDRKVNMKYNGNFTFVVTESVNSKLISGDIIKLTHIIRHYPLIVHSVVRDNRELGQFKAGKSVVLPA